MYIVITNKENELIFCSPDVDTIDSEDHESLLNNSYNIYQCDQEPDFTVDENDNWYFYPELCLSMRRN